MMSIRGSTHAPVYFMAMIRVSIVRVPARSCGGEVHHSIRVRELHLHPVRKIWCPHVRLEHAQAPLFQLNMCSHRARTTRFSCLHFWLLLALISA
eukprot:scaffold286157_cov30-Tisochrysis_lutea.AAC.2